MHIKKDDQRIDDVVLALEQDKIKSAAGLLKQLFIRPGFFRKHESILERLADKVAAACLQHNEYQDATVIYRALLCEYRVFCPGHKVAATRTKLMQTLAKLGQVSPISVKTNVTARQQSARLEGCSISASSITSKQCVRKEVGNEIMQM